MNQTREMLRALEQELQGLAARLKGRDAGAPEPGSLGLAEGDRGKDLFDQVQATESRESHFASRDRIVEKMQRVTAAIRRFKDGSYGECAECGQPIAPARLRAIPEATTCVACQERLERTGRWKEAQAAARASDIGHDGHGEESPSRVDLDTVQSATDILESLRESAVPEAGTTTSTARPAPARGTGRGGHDRAADRKARRGARAPKPGTRELVAG